MDLFSRKSGFKNVRDLGLFLIGISGLIPQIISMYRGGDVNLETLVFFGGLASSPYFMKKDEK